jgi:hypothetical protein
MVARTLAADYSSAKADQQISSFIVDKLTTLSPIQGGRWISALRKQRSFFFAIVR